MEEEHGDSGNNRSVNWIENKTSRSKHENSSQQCLKKTHTGSEVTCSGPFCVRPQVFVVTAQEHEVNFQHDEACTTNTCNGPRQKQRDSTVLNFTMLASLWQTLNHDNHHTVCHPGHCANWRSGKESHRIRRKLVWEVVKKKRHNAVV